MMVVYSPLYVMCAMYAVVLVLQLFIIYYYLYRYTAQLKGASFKKAIMKGVDLRAADCRSCNFDGADLTNAILIDAGIKLCECVHTCVIFRAVEHVYVHLLCCFNCILFYTDMPALKGAITTRALMG